jgi:hypothetical protein
VSGCEEVVEVQDVLLVLQEFLAELQELCRRVLRFMGWVPIYL